MSRHRAERPPAGLVGALLALVALACLIGAVVVIGGLFRSEPQPGSRTVVVTSTITQSYLIFVSREVTPSVFETLPGTVGP